MTEENKNIEPNGKDTKREEMTRTVKFVLFSISAGVIEMASFALLDALKVFDPTVCSIIALVISVIWNFTLNREFTFRAANNVPVAMLKVAAYYAVFTPLVSGMFFDYLVKTCGWNDILAKALTMVINFVTEYLYDRFVVFGKSIDTNKRAQAKGNDE
jgi:putative flippase GtrA